MTHTKSHLKNKSCYLNIARLHYRGGKVTHNDVSRHFTILCPSASLCPSKNELATEWAYMHHISWLFKFFFFLISYFGLTFSSGYSAFAPPGPLPASLHSALCLRLPFVSSYWETREMRLVGERGWTIYSIGSRPACVSCPW